MEKIELIQVNENDIPSQIWKENFKNVQISFKYTSYEPGYC